MKKLFLKNGQALNVKAMMGAQNEPFITIYDSENERVWNFIISRTNEAGMRLELPSWKNHLAWDEIAFVAEISENFNQYFNNLNQWITPK